LNRNGALTGVSSGVCGRSSELARAVRWWLVVDYPWRTCRLALVMPGGSSRLCRLHRAFRRAALAISLMVATVRSGRSRKALAAMRASLGVVKNSDGEASRFSTRSNIRVASGSSAMYRNRCVFKGTRHPAPPYRWRTSTSHRHPCHANAHCRTEASMLVPPCPTSMTCASCSAWRNASEMPWPGVGSLKCPASPTNTHPPAACRK
jgi:hypothetical protein